MDLLRSHGALPRSQALFSYALPKDTASIKSALLQWQRREFDWALFTSGNAVRSVCSLSRVIGIDFNAESRPSKIAAVGPMTAQVLADFGLNPDYVASTHTGVALAEELSSELRDKKIFLPRSDRANPDLPNALKRMTAEVTEVVAYRIEKYSSLLRDGNKEVITNEADAVLFYSPSAVHIVAELLGRDALVSLFHKVAAGAIGPVTAAALHDQGVENVVVAQDTTTEAVFSALENHFAKLETERRIPGAPHG
jgi:uroporphyrinogen-III synthase